MTYFLLSITNTCNKACAYCVVKPWLNNPEYPDKATAEDFIRFLQGEMVEGDVVEITGGEPTLFHNFLVLFDFLKHRGAKVVLRTNGFNLSRWRKSYDNMVVVLAKHDSADEYMEERKRHLLPHDLVLDGIPDDIKQKEPNKPVFRNDSVSPLQSHPFQKSFFITNDGKVRCMPCSDKDMGTIWDFKPRPYHCCRECPYMLGAWNLVNRIKEAG